MLVAAAVATAFGAAEGGFASPYSRWTILYGGLVLGLFQLRGLYRLRIKLHVLDDVRVVLTQTTFAAMILLTVRIMLSAPTSIAAESIRPWAFAAVYVGAGRVALYWSQTKARVAGESMIRPTLIVGAGRVGRTIAKRIGDHPEFGLKVVGFVDADPLEDLDGLDAAELPVLGDGADLERVVGLYGVKHLIITFSTSSDEELLALVNRAEALGIGTSIVPRLYEKVPERVTIEHLGGLPLLTAHPTNPRGAQMAFKYTVDRLVGLVGFVLISPIFGAAALAVYLSMGRPIFFKQIRVGRDGRTFGILKFRSMKLATPEEIEAGRKAIADGSAPGGVEGVDRRTKVGAILRKTSIDELPQLLNVIKGDMSLVGPRPERPEFVSSFEHSVYRYADRHRVKSGITGWAQVHGLRGKTSIADRAEWDNYYIENFSLWLDLKILVMTVGAVLGQLKEVE
jgi:exopolysaccharide biosynthesis polyprenyl glycosylphosphotransferase